MNLTQLSLPTRFVYGSGCLRELGALAGDLGGSRVLVVSDAGIAAAGHTERGISALESAGITTALFDRVAENPTTEHVADGVDLARAFQPTAIVGLGGGSSMDCAKGINFIYSCGGRMQDYWGIGKATGPMLPMIAVPTTAGTGSEAQSFALISDADTHVKMACGDKRAAFQVALLDPELTLTQPSRLTALTGCDALAHAVETFVTRTHNWMSRAFSAAAWQHLATNLPRVLANPDDIEIRVGMQFGACLAGLAIENSMLGSAHALANPLTATCGIAHGEAVALMLPHVVRFNGRHIDDQYRLLTSYTPDAVTVPAGSSAASQLAAFLEQVRQQAALAGTLRECDVPRSSLPELATAALEQWTGKFNPVDVTQQDYLTLYEAAY